MFSIQMCNIYNLGHIISMGNKITFLTHNGHLIFVRDLSVCNMHNCNLSYIQMYDCLSWNPSFSTFPREFAEAITQIPKTYAQKFQNNLCLSWCGVKKRFKYCGVQNNLWILPFGYDLKQCMHGRSANNIFYDNLVCKRLEWNLFYVFFCSVGFS